MNVLTGPLLSGSKIEEQIERERDSIRAGVERYWDLVNDAVDKGGGASLKPAERLLKHWFEPTVAMIANLRTACRKGLPGINHALVGPILEEIEPEKAAVLSLHALVSYCMANPRGVKMRQASHRVGSAIVAHLNMQHLRAQEKDADTKWSRKYDWFYATPTAETLNAWCRKHVEDPYHVPEYYKIGAALIDCICKAASAGDYMEEVFDPAFTHELRTELIQHGAQATQKTVGYISLSLRCLQIILDGHEARQAFRPRYSPMIVQPVAWTHEVEGGYMQIRTPLIAGITPSHKAWVNERAKAGQMEMTYATVNMLNSTAWCGFQEMAQLVDDLYHKRGGNIWNIKGGCEIPNANDFPYPPKVKHTDPEEIRAQKKRRRHIHNQNLDLFGLRQSFCYRLDQAKELMGRDRFYIPHQYDSRGRCFARSQFNHHSDKVWRSMLLFADRAPMTQEGWYWLHVQAANAFGIDNVSFDDRVAWAMKHQDQMKECARRPLDETWWREGESPFEFLAACKAIADPRIGERFPVQRDGTANGLQHFVAMTKDEKSAPFVNMVKTDAPASAYATVIGEAKALMARDAAISRDTMEWTGAIDGEVCRRSIGCAELAGMLLPIADKDVVKQRTMTTIYGVTEIGARNQIYEKLKVKGLPDDMMFPASQYLAQVVGKCVGKVYARASAAMEYLQRIARMAVDHEERALRWLTPANFPSQQPYVSYAKLTVKTELQAITIGDGSIKPSIRKSKQVSAFVANTTHGIDGAHMSMTGLRFSRPDRPFAQVCDCFWTRPSDIDALDVETREAMIELHSRDIIGEMRDYLESDRPGLKLPDPPERGTYDINEFRHSQYGFH